jgi:glycosyltransferase involved in cell wall biosynthesis
MGSPQISVIVPVYNGAGFLPDCLRGIFSQTFAEFEVVIIDDGSKDASGEVVRSCRDPRVRYVRQENQGLCHALNRGIQEASAPLVARNDQDDLSLPNRLARQVEVMRDRPEAVALFTHYTKFGRRRSWSNADKQGCADGSLQEIEPIRDGCLLGSTMLARTEALRAVGGYRQACYPCDDYDLEMRLCQRGKVLLLREALVRYRFHVAANTYRLFAVMQNKSRWVEDCYQRRLLSQEELTFEEFMQRRTLSWVERVSERRLDRAKLHMRVAGQRYLDGRDLAAFVHLCSSLIVDPATIYRRAKRFLRPRR